MSKPSFPNPDPRKTVALAPIPPNLIPKPQPIVSFGRGGVESLPYADMAKAPYPPLS